MAFYEELEGLLNLSTSMLLQNQNICKLLYYYPEEVSYQYDPLTKPNIENTSSLLLKNIYPLPKIPEAETKQICFIDVTLEGGEVMKENPRFRNIILNFDIICHLDAWIIKGGFRPLKLVSEIDKMFNYQIVPLDIINKPIALPLYPKDYSNKFYGYQLSYKLQVNSNLEC